MCKKREQKGGLRGLCPRVEQEIYIHMERINNEEITELLEIHYLFYDGYNYTS
jgi:hypothetical protein